MTGGLSVFVASSQGTLPGNAALPLSRIDRCYDGSVSDSFYDIIGEDLFVDVNHSCVVVKGRL